MLKDIARDPKKVSVYGVDVNEQTKKEIKKELFNNPAIHLAQSQVQTEPKKCPWKSARTKEGLLYYWNIYTKQSTWDKPANFFEDESDTVKKTKPGEGKRPSTQESTPVVKKSRIVFNNIKRDPKPEASEIIIKDLKSE